MKTVIQSPTIKRKGPWQKGQSGNPNGRPKVYSITESIRDQLQKYPDGQGKNKKTYLELITKKIFDKAVIDGDINMLKAVWNYMDGMPKQSVDTNIDLKVSISKIINNLEDGGSDIKRISTSVTEVTE